MIPRMIHLVNRYRAALSAVAVLGLLALSMVAIHKLASHVQPGDIRKSFAAVPGWRIGWAILLTAASYTLLTFYDVIALRVIGRPLPYRVAALASFTSYTLSHNIGFSWLTGGSARMRIYGVAGLGGGDVARIITLAGLSFWAGVAAVLGLGLVFGPHLALRELGALDTTATTAIGAALIAMVVIWLSFSVFAPRGVRVFGFSLPAPPLRLALAQLAVAMLDICVAAASFTILLPHARLTDLPGILVTYCIGITGGLVTHVPGGIGVFETAMMLGLPQWPAAALLSALLLYRLIYYILPLLLAAAALLAHEGSRLRHPAIATLKGIGAVVEYVAPSVAAIISFMAGVVLLISAVLPAVPERLAALHKLLPLAFIEISHFASSLVGTALILFAPALYRRLDGAYLLIRILLIAGIVVSLAKGFDWEEALVLTIVLALLTWSRKAFYRRTRLSAEPVSLSWVWAGAAVALVAVAIGMFSYKHVPYDESLWWTFTLHGNGSRFLRALLGLGTAAAAFFLWHGFAPPPGGTSDTLQPEVMNRAFASASRADAWLATTGDKEFLVAAEGDAFLMYCRRGRSWISIGDPIGPFERWPDLMWRLRELADHHQGRVLFYQLSAAAMPFAVDMGLTLLKYGEEARVDLSAFTLEGPPMKNLRAAVRRLEREGASFDVLPAHSFSALHEELKQVSDGWLAGKHGREKGFSVGRFDLDYLKQMPLAVIRREDRIIAFANIWAMPDRDEMSIDLMRHLPDTPNGTMEYLFVSLFLWGRENGYRHFNLGLAPLAGLEGRKLAPAWSQLGHLLYRHGENIYGFEGLRAFKQKFQPQWEPRYIAAPAGLPLVRALFDLVRLISR